MPRSIQLITLCVAYCSITYELLLAHSLSSLLGNTLLRYSMTIGIYICSLGLGAIILDRYRIKYPLSVLIKVEIVLSIVGMSTPVIVFAMDALAQSLAHWLQIPFDHSLIQSFNKIQMHGLIIFIGILSRFEIPLLWQWAEQQTHKKASAQVLAIDYLGTVIGAVAFPLLILPIFGLTVAAMSTGLINVLVALMLLMKQGVYCSKMTIICLSCVALAIVGMIWHTTINQWIIHQLFFIY